MKTDYLEALESEGVVQIPVLRLGYEDTTVSVGKYIFCFV